MVGAGDDLKVFRSHVSLKQPAAGFHRNDFIGTRENDFYRASIVPEVFGWIEAVEQKEIRRNQGHLSLGHGSQIVIGHEKHKSGDFRGVRSGQITSHSRADGFAHQVLGQAIGQQTKGFIASGKETLFIRRTRTGTVPGIFENVNINWRGVMDGAGKISAVNRATGIAVGYQNARDG